jgi:hypothetical protein
VPVNQLSLIYLVKEQPAVKTRHQMPLAQYFVSDLVAETYLVNRWISAFAGMTGLARDDGLGAGRLTRRVTAPVASFSNR